MLDQNSPVAAATLKVCLRLEDETPFLGNAMVRVTPEQGNELLGMPADGPGEFLFSGISSGKYAALISAPGYDVLSLTFKIDEGPRQKSLFVPMKPKFAAIAEAAPKAPAAAKNVEPAEAPKIAEAVSAEPVSEPVSEPPAVPLAKGERDFWAAHELEAVPPVDPDVACPCEDVLRGVGKSMTEFVRSLERFTATERLEHYAVDRSGARKSPETRSFAYVVSVSQNRLGTFLLDEFRNGKSDAEEFPAHTASRGSPAMALLFHPVLATDFEFYCEGLGQWAGRNAWQVHFLQRTDHPIRIRSYSVGGKSAGVPLEGRVWIDPGNYQVLRLESELVKPLPEISLTREHFIIDYQPVRFHSTGQLLWLPQTAELYVERKGKRFYRRHIFSDFRLFNVDSSQKIQNPSQSFSFTNTSDGDISGELTVESPDDVTRLSPVTIRFVVPAHSQIFKLVGKNKDIDLPPSAVGSATFIHDGDPAAIKVDTHLDRSASLDVVSRTKLPAQEQPALQPAAQGSQP